MQILDHEEFEGAKVLADIGLKIAEGRATLRDLETNRESYLAGREEEAIKRIAQVLGSSRDLLTELNQYHSELDGYRKEVTDFVADIRCLLESVGTFKQSFDQATLTLRGDLDRRERELDTTLVEIRKARTLLEADSAALARDKKKYREDKRALNDDWLALERAAKEINSKKA